MRPLAPAAAAGYVKRVRASFWRRVYLRIIAVQRLQSGGETGLDESVCPEVQLRLRA